MPATPRPGSGWPTTRRHGVRPTAGGLAATLRQARWRLVGETRFPTGAVAVKAIWRKQTARAIHRSAAAAFARGQGVPLGTALAAFAYGD